MDIDVIFEDADIAVVDKPAGVIVHAAPGHEACSLADELVRRCPGMAHVGSAERPGVVHRLDLETSGVMVFAKTQRAYLALRRQFESHRDVRKTYLAVVHGTPKPKSGTIDTPVGPGRMHQIRIHAAELGCPVVGDRTYGSAERDRRMRRRPARLLLHAAELSFLHPATGSRVTFSSPPPDDIVYAG